MCELLAKYQGYIAGQVAKAAFSTFATALLGRQLSLQAFRRRTSAQVLSNREFRLTVSLS